MAKEAPVLVDQASRLQGGQLMMVVRLLFLFSWPSFADFFVFFDRFLQFFGLQLALFLSFLDSTSVSTAAPVIGVELNASSSITWVGSSFLLANTAFQIVTSRLSDIFGRKAVLLGSLFLFVLGDLLCGFAQSGVWLYACRGIAGIGGGGIKGQLAFLLFVFSSSLSSFSSSLN
jgi:MFS family permease